VLTVGAVLLFLFSALSLGLGRFRTWVHAAPARQAPLVALSIGDDALNACGLHQAAYQAAITRAGGRAWEVRPSDGLTPAQVLARADAVVLTGGGDVDPRLYGGQPGTGRLVDPERDVFEAGLIREALAGDVPLLAVCRGHQLLNVTQGGTLRDLRSQPGPARRHGVTPRDLVTHPVQLFQGSLLRGICGSPELRVTSFHGQAVDQPAPRLRVAAWSPDGVVEALEVPGRRFAVGVQWHPELEAVTDPAARALFARLLIEAGSRAASRGSSSWPPGTPRR
jgi:putative glutamine amidotransferase